MPPRKKKGKGKSKDKGKGNKSKKKPSGEEVKNKSMKKAPGDRKVKNLKSGCGFTATEVRHDLKDAITSELMSKPEWRRVMAADASDGCRMPIGPNNGIRSGTIDKDIENGPQENNYTIPPQFFNDPGIVNQILGKTVTDIVGLAPKTWHPVEKVKIANPTSEESVRIFSSNSYENVPEGEPSKLGDNPLPPPLLGKKANPGWGDVAHPKGFLQLYVLPKANGDGVEYTAEDLLRLFPITDHIFLTIDTGDNIVDKLKELVPTPSPPCVDIMYNTHTLGDSAPKTKPDVKKRNYDGENLTLKTWFDQKKLTVVEDDPIFKSAFSIETRPAKYEWKVYQLWQRNPDGGPNFSAVTWDAHSDNEKNKSVKELNDISKNEIFKSRSLATPSDTETRQKINYALQKKRSGDWFQIKGCKDTPEKIATIPEAGILIKPDHLRDTDPENKLGSDSFTQQDVRKRNFFLTGDWPAWAYAIYCGLNTVMQMPHSDRTKACFICAYWCTDGVSVV